MQQWNPFQKFIWFSTFFPDRYKSVLSWIMLELHWKFYPYSSIFSSSQLFTNISRSIPNFSKQAPDEKETKWVRFPCSSPREILFSLLSKLILEQPWWAQFQKWMANLREQRLAQITCKSRLKIQFHLRFHWERCMLRKLCEFVSFKFPIIFTQIQCCMLKWEEQFPTMCLINWSMTA